MISDKENEYLEQYIDGKPSGIKILRKDAHDKGLQHPVCHIWISDLKGNLLLQKRSKNKISNPNLYDISSAGHILFGESPKEASVKEVEEELGLKFKESQFNLIGEFEMDLYESNNGSYKDNEYFYVYHVEINEIKIENLKLQKCEVQGVGVMFYQNVLNCYIQKNKHFVEYNTKDKYFLKISNYFNNKYQQFKKSNKIVNDGTLPFIDTREIDE